MDLDGVETPGGQGGTHPLALSLQPGYVFNRPGVATAAEGSRRLKYGPPARRAPLCRRVRLLTMNVSPGALEAVWCGVEGWKPRGAVPSPSTCPRGS